VNVRIRLPVAVLTIWLLLVYNIERLGEPIHITGVVYALVPLVVALIILVPPLRNVPSWSLLAASVWAFWTLKVAMGHRTWGAALPLTVMEMCVIAVTVVLACWVSNGMSEFETAVAHITIGRVGKSSKPMAIGQAEMYREIRRARRYQRSLSLMVIGIEDESMQVAVDRIVQDIQKTMMKRYVLSSVAETLCNELEDHNIVAHSGDQFWVLLPEVTAAELNDLVDSLQASISERVGVALQVGTASFPEDAMTFDSLMERAVEEMEEKRELDRLLQSRG
jgi:GGDEF domain-containing protein